MPKARPTVTTLQLRLYVAGNGPNSALARANISALCHEEFPDAFELEVVDLIESPLRALADGIVVTPTLLKLAPAPTRRIIGNLNNAPQVLLALRNT
ncbi:MAG: circadian clock protein KaiB [Phycisphaerae bacterium]|nr:circadian clock protein KaiB [Gemmatimonadaceae bacterium]